MIKPLHAKQLQQVAGGYYSIDMTLPINWQLLIRANTGWQLESGPRPAPWLVSDIANMPLLTMPGQG